MSIKLIRISNEPILSANKDNDWEKASCFNAGAIKEAGVIHMFYRATDKNCNGNISDDYMNYIGHATSIDGIRFHRDKDYILGPQPNSQWQRGCEDPRVMKLENKFYMLYTGFSGRFPGDYRICMATSDDLFNWKQEGVVLKETNKDAAFFSRKINGEYILLHRRSPNIWLCYSKDLKTFYNHTLFAERDLNNEWESSKIGIAGPPIETEKGFILIYHGVSEKKKDFGEKGEYSQYSLGIMLLDKKDPTKIVYRQKEAILEPELDWELDGNVPNVVFSCGQVIQNDELYVYYAGADQQMGVAKVKLGDINKLFSIGE